MSNGLGFRSCKSQIFFKLSSILFLHLHLQKVGDFSCRGFVLQVGGVAVMVPNAWMSSFVAIEAKVGALRDGFYI